MLQRPAAYQFAADFAPGPSMRKYVHREPRVGQNVILEGNEHHHLAHVARHRPGDQIILLDGRGFAYSAQIMDVERKKTVVAVLSREEISERPHCSLRIATAVPRRKRMHMLIEKCSELGVHEVATVVFSRSVVKPSTAEVQRWERISAESAKQCGRSVFMEVAAPRALLDSLSDHDGSRRTSLVASLEPGAMPLAEVLPVKNPVDILIGPEGGLTGDEQRAVAEAGYRPVSLGALVLRVETAAIAAAARLLV